MLEKYKTEQPLAYRMLKQAIEKNRLAHAYIFETKGYSKSLNFAIDFVKNVMCKGHNNHNDCIICNRIEKNIFPELKIINPDGLWIKKEQLENLQEEFSKKPLESDKRIYIINSAEKLNISSSNSLLKFLEEPANNIIAILLTDNRYQLIETIISRCQIVPLNKAIDKGVDNTLIKIANTIFKDNNIIKEYIDNERNNVKVVKIVEFINFYEKNGMKTLLYLPKKWHEYYIDKEEIAIAFDILILYYKDVLNVKLGREVEIFTEYIKMLKLIANNNTVLTLGKKINIIFKSKDKINYNVNNNLLMDKFIIELERVE